MYRTRSASQDDGEDLPSMTDIAKCLRDAGSYDGSLTEEQMLELYKVLNDSKTTAIAEDKQRRTTVDDSFIDEMRLHSIPVENSPQSLDFDDSETSPSHTSIVAESVLSPKTNSRETADAKKQLDGFDEIDVLSSVPTKHPPLPEISYKPKYDPPLYCNPKFLRLSLTERKKLLTEYHNNLIRIYDSFHRRSSHYTTLGKPIQPDVNFNGSLLKTSDTAIDFNFEDEDVVFEQNNNSDDVYVTKTGRQTKRKLYTEPNDSWKSKLSKRKNISSLNNDQIMKRSKLFSTPKSEKLFDKLQEAQEKEKKEEKENLNFINSLVINNSDDEFEDDVAEIVHSDEPFIRRRITPPSQFKKSTRGGGRNAKPKKLPVQPKENSLAEEPPAVIDKAVCPMCSLEFPQDKLEMHANECIDTYEQTNTSAISFNDSKKITCEKCDQVLPFNMDYEIHVRDCLTKST